MFRRTRVVWKLLTVACRVEIGGDLFARLLGHSACVSLKPRYGTFVGFCQLSKPSPREPARESPPPYLLPGRLGIRQRVIAKEREDGGIEPDLYSRFPVLFPMLHRPSVGSELSRQLLPSESEVNPSLADVIA